jgi:hypothetical protein
MYQHPPVTRCHALTFLFYRIFKCQKVRFSLVGIDRRVDDPAVPTGVQLNPPGPAAAPAGGGTPGEARGPISAELRAEALKRVDGDLRAAELLNSDGQVSQEAVVRFCWERTVRLPTPGVIVKSCLDECDACEPSREREIELDLEAKELENRLLQPPKMRLGAGPARHQPFKSLYSERPWCLPPPPISPRWPRCRRS